MLAALYKFTTYLYVQIIYAPSENGTCTDSSLLDFCYLSKSWSVFFVNTLALYRITKLPNYDSEYYIVLYQLYFLIYI